MSNQGENFVAVLFVLALIYSGLLVLSFARSYNLVCRRGHTQKYRQVFTGFYSLIWSTLILTIILYIMMTVNFFTSLENVYGVVSFYFLPTILMVLCYVLLYYQLEIMMTVSRIESSQNYVGRLQSKYVAECIRITMLTLIYVFVALQLILMVLCFF